MFRLRDGVGGIAVQADETNAAVRPAEIDGENVAFFCARGYFRYVGGELPGVVIFQPFACV
jgi:hypothetical protein